MLYNINEFTNININSLPAFLNPVYNTSTSAFFSTSSNLLTLNKLSSLSLYRFLYLILLYIFV